MKNWKTIANSLALHKKKKKKFKQPVGIVNFNLICLICTKAKV